MAPRRERRETHRMEHPARARWTRCRRSETAAAEIPGSRPTLGVRRCRRTARGAKPPIGSAVSYPHGIAVAFERAARRLNRAPLRKYFNRLFAARTVLAEFSRHRDDGRWWLMHARTVSSTVRGCRRCADLRPTPYEKTPSSRTPSISTSSASSAAPSAICRAPQEGQKPRRLQLNATSFSA
jgi:hypothetical protein